MNFSATTARISSQSCRLAKISNLPPLACPGIDQRIIVLWNSASTVNGRIRSHLVGNSIAGQHVVIGCAREKSTRCVVPSCSSMPCRIESPCGIFGSGWWCYSSDVTDSTRADSEFAVAAHGEASNSRSQPAKPCRVRSKYVRGGEGSRVLAMGVAVKRDRLNYVTRESVLGSAKGKGRRGRLVMTPRRHTSARDSCTPLE